RIARRAIEDLRAARPDVPVCCYGLYGTTMDDVADCALAGETDDALVRWVESGDAGETVILDRSAARVPSPLPARDLLPELDGYVHLLVGDEHRTVGYVEASHGCAHRCRHCPVPVVYDGRIRVVAEETVLADIEQQVDAGARHITFGDPD